MIRRRWWQESPVTRESAKETVKPSRGECRCCGLTCGDLRLVYFLLLYTGPWVRAAHPAFPAPSICRGWLISNPGVLRCGNVEACLVASLRGAKAPKQSSLHLIWIASSRSLLAMTAVNFEMTGAMTKTSIHRDACEFDHLAPLLGLIGNELAEFGGRHRFRKAAHFGQARHELGVLQRVVDRLVELLHDFRRRALRRGNAVETDRL